VLCFADVLGPDFSFADMCHAVWTYQKSAAHAREGRARMEARARERRAAEDAARRGREGGEGTRVLAAAAAAAADAEAKRPKRRRAAAAVRRKNTTTSTVGKENDVSVAIVKPIDATKGSAVAPAAASVRRSED
jgi:sRNA-binding protein